MPDEKNRIYHLNIFSTSEEPQETALGKWQGSDFLGIALPCSAALRKRAYVRYNGIICYVEVADVGPWSIDDFDYVFGDARPRAEIYKGLYCPRTKNGSSLATVPDGKGGWLEVEKSNGSGCDLYPGTYRYLGIPPGQNVFIDWWFE